jgi:hypothetical protein
MTKAYARPRSRSLEKGASAFSGAQPDLFGVLDQPRPPVIHQANAPDLNIWALLRGAIDVAMRNAASRQISRPRIADRMNLALPGLKSPVTKRMVDSWMADSKEFHRLPAEWLAAFCWAVEDETPLQIIARTLGYELVDAQQLAAKQLGDAHVEIANLKRTVLDLTRRLSR